MTIDYQNWFKFGFIKCGLITMFIFFVGMTVFMTPELEPLKAFLLGLGALGIIVTSAITGLHSILARWLLSKAKIEIKQEYLKLFVVSSTFSLIPMIGPGLHIVAGIQALSVFLTIKIYKQMKWRLPN